jgi:Flp pilus assembly protein CpaB
MKRSRLGITILLALVLASAAAMGVYAVASQNESGNTAAPSQAAPTSVPSTSVVIATQNIAAATTLTANMVDVIQVPVELKNDRAVSDPAQVVGKMAAVTLLQGEQILDSRVTNVPIAGGDTFAGSVPVGKRAISLVFDEVIGSGALVQPGDHVDVLAFFELKVSDLTKPTATATAPAGQPTTESTPEEGSFDYKQYVSTYIVQDVEVLAVSQALTPEELGVEGQAVTPTPTVDGTDAVSVGEPVARPGAKSVTLAVTPEQAQRLLLAAQTVKNEKGSLRLAMRAPGDTTIANLPPAQLGNIPVGDLLGDVDKPMVPSDVIITHAEFTERVISSGNVLEFKATVKNVSDHTIKSVKDARPGFEYTQGVAYDALGFFPKEDTYRIGLSFAGAYPNPFPYRWGFGGNLEPGQSVEITGSVRLTEATAATKYWLGIIQEPNTVTQDGVNVADVTVIQADAATVSADSADLRADPNGTAAVVGEVAKGDTVEIVQARSAWFKVRAGKTEGWIEVSAVTVPPTGDQSASTDDGN